jgi:hypothetical protein
MVSIARLIHPNGQVKSKAKNLPIYMDRHEMEGATAKAAVGAHQKDLELQEK